MDGNLLYVQVHQGTKVLHFTHISHLSNFPKLLNEEKVLIKDA